MVHYIDDFLKIPTFVCSEFYSRDHSHPAGFIVRPSSNLPLTLRRES